ncbi:hypothetical protein [Caulobacter sp. UNC358MFTsu5.1]|uniref:hypothetical protein n=1 Tax=Caulobacter sp. UNC358MFTsu5.1 TaxID=1449049 RepID=UPI0012DE164B|nr:hypothetical protein [Caulobacter sp. UNC358MFTsu5.1]
MQTDDIGLAALKASLQRQYDFAKPKAEFLRSARIDFNSKLRFGAFGVNAASSVAWGTLYSSLGAGKLEALGLGFPVVVGCLALFLVGAWLAGAALVAQHTDLIDMQGDAELRVMKFQAALTALDRIPVDGHDKFQAALSELHEVPVARIKHEQWPIHLTGASTTCWGTAAVWIAAQLISKPIWDWAWPIFH